MTYSNTWYTGYNCTITFKEMIFRDTVLSIDEIENIRKLGGEVIVDAWTHVLVNSIFVSGSTWTGTIAFGWMGND